MTTVLDAITIYPVKSLRGVAVQEAVVEPWGLAGDRRWMVVDENGRYTSRSQRVAWTWVVALCDGLT